MAFLLDANVLIALIDPLHIKHDAAHSWFATQGQKAWATCPLTENAVLRIVGHARYPNSPGTPAAIVPMLASLCALPGHEFWPDEISILSHDILDPGRLLNASHVTDTYLLALACARGGQLATFDHRLVPSAVRHGVKALHFIP